MVVKRKDDFYKGKLIFSIGKIKLYIININSGKEVFKKSCLNHVEKFFVLFEYTFTFHY